MKKIAAVIIIFATLFVFTVPAIAGTVNITETIYTSDVMDDLAGISVSGAAFNETDYPYDSSSDFCTLLTMFEYGYSYYRNFDKYNLIFYVYNPSCKMILDDYRNKVSLSVTRANANDDYYKYSLKMLSHSTDYRFIKFCIADDSLVNLVQKASGSPVNSRTYKISGIELFSYGATNAVDNKVASTYTFTGFSKGMGMSQTAASSLYVQVDNCFTVSLQVHPTIWRSDTSSAGQYHKNQVSSVYFSIPKSLESQYSKLSDIKCEWYEYKVGALVLDNYSMYSAIHPLSATRYDGNNGVDYTTKPCFYSTDKFFDGLHVPMAANTPGPGYLFNYCRGDYNESNIDSEYARSAIVFDNTAWVNQRFRDFPLDIIYPYVFYSSSFNSNGIDVSAEDFLDEIYDRGELFYDAADQGRTKGYNVQVIHSDQGVDINSYKSNHSWWDYLLDVGLIQSLSYAKLNDDSFRIETPIYNVSATDFIGSTTEVSNRLFIDKNDISELSNYTTREAAKGNSTYLLRFALTDYYSTDMYIDAQNYSGNTENVNCYYSEQTIFKNFNIIDLTFQDKYGNKVTIPVVSNPIDIVGSIEQVQSLPEIARGQNRWARVLAIILAVVAFAVIVYVVYRIIRKTARTKTKKRKRS